jgi:hypothetical protein
MRRTISTAAPGAQETMSYQMPSFRLYGALEYPAEKTIHTEQPSNKPLLPPRQTEFDPTHWDLTRRV